MADSKITALTAISTVDPAADPLVIVDVSDTSMAASGTTKKITSNQILGAGGTATLASATITGDLTVDTSTLKVDSTNNRVGIGTTSLFGDLNIQNGSNCRLEISSFATGTSIENLNNARNAYLNMTMYADTYIWNRLGSESMRLDSSGNVGIGVTPSAGGTGFYKTFEIGKAGCGLFVSTAGLSSAENTYFSGNAVLKYNSGPEWSYGNAGSAGIYGIEDGVHKWYNATSGSAGGTFTPTQAMTLDASGNLGVGVVPTNIANVTRFEIQGSISSNLTIRTASTNASARNWMVAANVNTFGDFVIRQGNSQGADPNSGTDRVIIDASGNFIPLVQTAAPTLGTNQQMVFTLTSNTNLRISVRGTDGTTRVANLTLA